MKKLGHFLLLLAFVSPAYADLKITIPAIKNGVIETVHACNKNGGQNVSPEIQINGVTENAKFVSLVMDDPDAQPVAGKTWVHWNIFNMPVVDGSVTLSAGKKPSGTVGKGSKGKSKYDGMCPPNGRHTYRFAVFSHENEVKAPSGFSAKGLTIEDFEKKYKDSIKEKVMITGDFG